MVDVYKPHIKNGLYLDINSSYPNSMLKPMPIGEPMHIKKEEFKKINLDNFFGFLTLTINVKKTNIPFIGIRDMKKKTIIYPYGTFTTSIFSEELKHAMKVNEIKIIKIHKMIEYNKDEIFENFVTIFFNKKKNSTLCPCFA